MYYCPYDFMEHDCMRFPERPSYLRVLHAAPNTPNVDVYVNNNRLLQNISYKEFSKYLPLSPGNYHIKVYPAGQKTNPVIDTNVSIPPLSMFTAAVIGKLPKLSLLPIPEPIAPQAAGTTCVRFAHLSPDALAVDVTIPTGTKLFSNVNYKEVTPYAKPPAGIYTIQIKLTRNGETVLTVSGVNLMADRCYTLYVVGLAAGNPPLEVLKSIDGRLRGNE